MKLSGLRYLGKQGLENVWKNRMMAFASFCVLLVSLLLVGLSILLFMNLNSIIGGIENKNEVIVFLDPEITQVQTEKVQSELELIENIDSISFYSKEEAFESMKDSMDEYANVFDSLGDDNPLPDSFRIRIENIDYTAETVSLIENIDYIYSIRAPYDFVNVLSELREILTWGASAIVIALAIVSMVIISNTTKASVFARRNEISIMKYVGATNAFIRIPFFVEGMVTGFAAGIIATIITWIGYDALVDLLTGEVNLLNVIGMGTIIEFGDIALTVAVLYILSGGLIGALGSVISTRKHLNV
ncbi:MAG: ABC transporter permease [Ruminococcus sp.]|nr:ABC transporter permease [Ruminococcus sp.]